MVSFIPSVHTHLKHVSSHILVKRTFSLWHPRQPGVFLKKTFIVFVLGLCGKVLIVVGGLRGWLL